MAEPQQPVKQEPKYPSKKALPKHMRQEVEEKPRHPSNSTSSLYISDTLNSPDVDELLRCMAIAIQVHIKKGHESEEKKFLDIFSEEKHPIQRVQVNLKDVPDWKTVYKFISAIFKAERLSPECAILCLAYIERMMTHTKVTMHASNWRRITLATLILASKVWEDQAVWNVDFLSVFPRLTVQDLAQLEKVLLDSLSFNVSLHASQYAKYYFDLKALADEAQKQFPLQPLTKEDAEKLEQSSEERENAAKKEFEGQRMQRSNSDVAVKTKTSRMVLN